MREVRRSFRQGLWSAVALSGTDLDRSVECRDDPGRGLGQEPAIAAQAAEYLRYKQWALLPMLGFVALRFFLAGMERPFLALVVSLSGLAVNALANYALIFGNFGAPAMGLNGAGIATTLTASFMFVMLTLIARRDRRFRRYALFGRFWRADWPRFFELLAAAACRSRR